MSRQVGKRYPVSTNGSPFLLKGDAAWSLIAQVSREDAVLYLNDRASRGFNTVLVNLVEHKFATNAPSNFYGNAPFTTPGDFSTPNDAYFAHADYVITQAAQRGILVLLAPAYLGAGGGDEGWYAAMQASGTTKLTAYGHYIANRYASYDNILWVNGGDYNPPDKTLTRAVAQGIKDILPNALQTVHCVRDTGGLDYWSGESWLNIDTTYTSGGVVDKSYAQYQKPEQMPFFLIEAYYENDPHATPTVLRQQNYATILSGGFGHVFGNGPIWSFDAAGTFGIGWKNSLGAAGSQNAMRAWNFYGAIRWDLLVPDINNQLVTAGKLTGDSKAAAALASDGSFAAIYVPNPRTLTVDLTRLTGPNVRARWFDPTNAAYTTINGSPFARASTNFTSPSANAGGQADFVLLLESV